MKKKSVVKKTVVAKNKKQISLFVTPALLKRVKSLQKAWQLKSASAVIRACIENVNSLKIL